MDTHFHRNWALTAGGQPFGPLLISMAASSSYNTGATMVPGCMTSLMEKQSPFFRSPPPCRSRPRRSRSASNF